MSAPIVHDVQRKTSCYHCGDDCGAHALEHDGKQFCCTGCQTVYDILSDNDLCTYYDLDKNPGTSLKAPRPQEKYRFLDNLEIVQIMCDFYQADKARIRLFIPAIHCSSCIWLLEKLHKLAEGVNYTRVNFVKKELAVDFNPSQVSLRQLVELLASVGYEPHISLEGKKSEDGKKANRSLYLKIGVAGFAFGNIMLLSFPEYFGFEGLDDPLIHRFISYLNLLLALPVFFYCSSDYFVAAYKGLKKRFINIDVPIALGIAVLFGRSLVEILSNTGPGYLDSLAGLLFFLLVGRWFQEYTYRGLSFERDYKSYFPLAVSRMKDQTEESVLVQQLSKGDTIVVRNQEVVPCDCTLLSAEAHIDYSFVTGEANLTKKQKGDYIYAGGRQAGPSIELLVEKDVSQSYLTQLWNNEAFTKDKEASFITLINHVSKYFTVAVLVLAIAGFFMYFQSDLPTAWNVLTAVLIIACPCALSLASPFTLGTTMRIFGKKGFYLKNTHIIEKISRMSAIIFDKTGTITQGSATTGRYEGKPLTAMEESVVKALVQQSSHPLSRRIYAMLHQKPTPGVDLEQFEEYAGLGLEGRAANRSVKLGSRAFVTDAMGDTKKDTSTHVLCSFDGHIHGSFIFDQSFRAGLENLVARLNEKYKIALLTGDNDHQRKVLKDIFKSEAALHFRQSPQDKLNHIKALQDGGEQVMMIGDGLNDAGALQQSDVGVSIVDDTAHFTPAADAILHASAFGRLPDLLRFTHTGKRIIIAAFLLSFLYNIIGIGLALAGMLTPLAAAILMPLSSISVVLFSTLSVGLMARIKGIL
jgi:Cu+-exporting ATPase